MIIYFKKNRTNILLLPNLLFQGTRAELKERCGAAGDDPFPPPPLLCLWILFLHKLLSGGEIKMGGVQREFVCVAFL
jgi:hypothetical protein